MTMTASIETALARLNRFRAICEASQPGDEARRLQEALRLVSPRHARAAGRMVASGAYESAVLALIGNRAALMFSRSGNGRCLASIAAPGTDGEVTAHGATPALALLAAWAAAAAVRSDAADGPVPHSRLH